MEKLKGSGRKIKFLSKKNQMLVCVHSKSAKTYAGYLEQSPEVISYEILKELDITHYPYINPVDIRKEYFELKWATDFVLHHVNGEISIREIVDLKSLYKRATVEQLEFSRRYWRGLKVRDWKMVILEGDI